MKTHKILLFFFQTLLTLILLTTTATNGQKLDVQNLNAGHGYITIRDEKIPVVVGYTKILHSINVTSWIDNLDIIEHNINKLNYKTEYPTITHNFKLLSKEVENLLENHHKQRRGLVNIVGKGLKYLTGTMDYDDEQEIRNSLETNEKNNKNLIDGLNDQIKVNYHFNEVIDNITKHINGQQLEIKTQLLNVGNAVNREFSKINSMQQAFQIQYDIQLLREQVRKVEENLLLSKLGVLGKDILSPEEVKKFNITISKLSNIKSTVIIHKDQIIFILLIPNYSDTNFYRILIEPIPNKNNLELVTPYDQFIRDDNFNYEYINGTIKFKDLKIIKDNCISNIFKENPKCNFKENKNIEIKQIHNNIVITKNIPYTQVSHNCNNFTLNVMGSNLLRFENCKLVINNIKYENFVAYDNFIIPSFSNITINKIVMNYSTEEIHLKNIENRNLLEEIKLKTTAHEYMNFGIISVIITIFIIIFVFISKNNGTSIKVNLKNADSPEKNLRGGGVTSETSFPFATPTSPHSSYFLPFANCNNTS